jgi:hypothetical protein
VHGCCLDDAAAFHACVRWERGELLHLDAKLDNGSWMVVKRQATSVAAATESLILDSAVGRDGRGTAGDQFDTAAASTLNSARSETGRQEARLGLWGDAHGKRGCGRVAGVL